jgi:hypothetical protein
VSSGKLTKFIAAGSAVIAVSIGGYAIGNSTSGNRASNSANAATAGGSGQAQGNGQVPANWRPGTGTIITGAAADKATAAALAEYPGGTVNRVLQLDARSAPSLVPSGRQARYH